uniref:Uncharacterized protein n=1 Tax=Meloidogyne enterolobii TaxID=390850 RepID=A0A6V7WIX8_MELEN|nr:unnamed protein product [Meloidogyne enterolobii]
MLIGEIYSTIIYCFATFGLFSNLFLIWLILRYTMKEMQVYSKILLQTCFVDIVGICMFVVSQPHLTNYELAKTLELDNYTIENYVVGQRTRTNNLSIFTSNYASALTIINYIIIIFCGISIQIRVYRHCKGVEMTQLRNMNKQMSIVLGAQAILPLMTYISNLFGNLNFLFNLPGLYSSSIIIFLTNSFGSLVAVLNPIVTILSVRNYRQIIFRCKNNSNINQVAPMPETSMPDRTIQYIK